MHSERFGGIEMLNFKRIAFSIVGITIGLIMITYGLQNM